MMPRISPAVTSKLTSLTARRPPKDFDSSVTVSSGVPVAAAAGDGRRVGGEAMAGSGAAGLGLKKRSRMVQNSPSGEASMMPMMATP